MKTVIRNKSEHAVSVKEGAGGVYRQLSRIEHDKHYVINVNSDATYREYVIIVDEIGQSLTLSSDDFQEYREIVIKKSGERDLTWEGVIRKLAAKTPAEAPTGRCTVL